MKDTALKVKKAWQMKETACDKRDRKKIRDSLADERQQGKR